MPRVSIIIPTHNRVCLLREAIDSVLNQTFKDIEVIVVDDAGAENVQSVIASYGCQNLRYLRNERNLGLAGTRNQGIAAAAGDYIGFLDDDDLFELTKIEKQVAVLDQQPAVDIVYCGYYYLYEDGRHLYENVALPEGGILKDLLLSSPILAHAPLVRRACFDRWGIFDASMRVCEDWDLWLRFAIQGCRYACIQEALCAYRQHRGNMTQKIEVWSKGHLVVLDRVFSTPGLPKDILALKPAAYARSRITVACAYFREMEFARGGAALQEALPEVVRGEPAFDQLVAGLAHAALTADSGDIDRFFREAGEHIQPAALSRQVCKRARSLVEFERANVAYREHHRREAIMHGFGALSNNFPGFYRNRGLYAILLKSVLHAPAARP